MFKRFIKWFFIVLITLFLGTGLGIFIYKDRIIQQVIVELNRQLSVPIEVSKVDIDFLHGFPNISVAFYNTKLPANSRVQILTAEKLYVIINPFALFQGELNADRLEIVNANLEIIIDENNNDNISSLFKSKNAVENDSLTTDAPVSLNSILLKEVTVNLTNRFNGSASKWQIPKLEGNFLISDGIYSSEVEGDINFVEMKTRNWYARKGRNINLELVFKYNSNTSELLINESAVRYAGAATKLSGTINFAGISKVDLKIDGDNISFDLFASFLPEKYASLFSKYQSKGQIDFNATVKGDVSSKTYPAINATVTLSDVDLIDSEFDANINKLKLIANLKFADLGDLSTGSMDIKDGQGLLDEAPFSFDLNVIDFLKPRFNGRFTGNISAEWLLGAIRYPYRNNVSGDIDLEITATGDYAKMNPKEQLKLGGYFNLNNISFEYSEDIQIDKLGGILQFKGNEINLSNLNLQWLESDITVNGSISGLDLKNKEDHVLLLRSDLRSNNLKIEDIVALTEFVPAIQPADSGAVYKPKLDVELLCKIENFRFQRSHSRQVVGEVTYADGVLEVVDINGKSMGGIVKLNGKMKQMNNRDIYIEARAQTKNVDIDSLFYAFKDFNQEFITQNNLKGDLFADVTASMFFDSTWRFRSKLLYADAKLGLIGGELNDFEPIMALSSYIDDKDDNLSRLRFSDLVNTIAIRRDTIFIPEMSIQTNVRNLALGGYHTLDQHINYQLAVPVINERVDKDEAFGAVQKSSKGSPNLLFRIKGTATDYKVNYDLLRATGNVLKLLDVTKIFKKNEEIPIDSSFLDDEEFDWEN